MPLYRFHCRSCGRDFNTFLSLSEADTGAVCPQCHGREVDGPLEEGASAPALQGGACDMAKRT